jgi:hypothetical protein
MAASVAVMRVLKTGNEGNVEGVAGWEGKGEKKVVLMCWWKGVTEVRSKERRVEM